MINNIILRKEISDLAIPLDKVSEHLEVVNIATEDKLFREVGKFAQSPSDEIKVLCIIHASTLIEKFHRKIKEADKIIRDFFNIIPYISSDVKPIILVEKMLEGFYPMQCIARRELEEISNLEVRFLPYKTLEINKRKINYSNIGEVLALCGLENNERSHITR